MEKKVNYYTQKINIHAHTSVPWQQMVVMSFLKKIGRNQNARCLDVGTGIGNNLETIAAFVSEIEAFDISPEVVENVKNSSENKKIPLKIICANAENMPYPGEMFDIVICTEVLEHCLRPESVIRECSRVLKPGGCAIFSIPNYFNPAGLIKKIYDSSHEGKTWDAWGNHECGIENFTTSFWLNGLLNIHGFSVVERRGGDLIRSWLPFLRRFYTFIDRYPFLGITKKWPLNMCAMNYFCCAKKRDSSSPR